MKNLNKQLKVYYCDIRRCLHCKSNLKRKIRDTIAENVDAFLEENPSADFQSIQQHFGTPQQIASAYIDETPSEELIKKLKLRKTVIAVVCTATAAALLMWGIVLSIAILDNHEAEHGYIETFITEE